MIAAIMQPYFFPYIGYFQLMSAVDVFVFHDDAQYIKGGWVNRNRIMVDGHVDWLTMPVRKASNYLPINEREYAVDANVVDKMMRRIAAAYRTAGYGDAARQVFEALSFSNANVAAFNRNSLQVVADGLGIACEFASSSDFGESASLKGQEKVIDLCRRVGARRYINPIGGIDLYDPSAFSDAGIELAFLRTQAPATSTVDGPQHLSVIDGLMHSGFEGCRELLPECVILEKAAARMQA